LPQYLKSLIEPLRKPEWIAAIALLIQAVILPLQAKILGRHAETMERHAEIAGTQAETAKLIGQALDQQGKVLNDQTKIMADQFTFQRRLEIKAEREKVFDLLLELHTKAVALQSRIGSLQPGATITQEGRERLNAAWDSVGSCIVPCQRALLTSIHLPNEEKDYFLKYVLDADSLRRTGDAVRDMQTLRTFFESHKDFPLKLIKAAKTPANP
jgi:hypothetical protein